MIIVNILSFSKERKTEELLSIIAKPYRLIHYAKEYAKKMKERYNVDCLKSISAVNNENKIISTMQICDIKGGKKVISISHLDDVKEYIESNLKKLDNSIIDQKSLLKSDIESFNKSKNYYNIKPIAMPNKNTTEA